MYVCMYVCVCVCMCCCSRENIILKKVERMCSYFMTQLTGVFPIETLQQPKHGTHCFISALTK